MSLLDTKTSILDVKVTFQCNNLCRFCAAGDKRKVFPDPELKKLLELLNGNAGERDTLVLTGGEPTLRPDLPHIIRHARRNCGFSSVIVQTNGRRFAYRDYAETLIDAGAAKFMVSIHGHKAALHDFLTTREGSFAETVLGIKNLSDAGATVAANTVITNSSYRNLPEIQRMLCALGVAQMQFAFPHLVGKAKVNAARLAPPMSLVKPYLFRALDAASAAGRLALTEGFPLCMLQGKEVHAAESIHSRIMVVDENRTIEDFHGHRRAGLKAKGPDCPRCRHFHSCEGPWADYPELFSWKEFVPVN